MPRARVAAAGLVLLALTPAARAAPAPPLVTWSTRHGSASDRPTTVGSLQKPFVAAAWARAHPQEAPPRLRCAGGSACWFRPGHGELGLTRALARSCNAYFLQLAQQTPSAGLAAALREAGFLVPEAVDAEAAIGIVTGDDSVVIRPRALLDAYTRLVGEPWDAREDVRRALSQGLREAAESGTASALGAGFWAKTGTVPALDGRPLATSGWVVAGDGGRAILALLPRGTGRGAALALAARLRAGSGLAAWGGNDSASGISASGSGTAHSVVRVRLFEPLAPRRVVVRNVGARPTPGSRGYLGPGASRSLAPGDRLGPGVLELTLPEHGLIRRLRGALRCEDDGAERLRLAVEVRLRDYVDGVLLAELAPGHDVRRVELGAALLRFLAAGPRHGTLDVCDTTHCAYFVGLGPRVAWPEPRRARLLAPPGSGALAQPGLDDDEWHAVTERARGNGPSLWTAHCGGEPLSPHAVWGNGDRERVACGRHAPGSGPWRRLWDVAALRAAFGGEVERVAVDDEAGVWRLRVDDRSYSFDDAHKRLASSLGWDALPSPARRVRAIPGGFEAEGVGAGHRVGLCLGADPGPGSRAR